MKKISRLQFFLGISIVSVGLFIRLIWLGAIPAGLTNDEANVGYDAFSILKTGKDQWGERQPATHLKGFGDYRPPVYTYAVIPSVSLFDLNEFSVRLPSAIFGSLTVLAVFFLAVLLFENILIALVAMFLLAISPWHIAMSRVGIESTLGVLITALAVIFFLLGTNKKIWLFPAMGLFALTIYTYTSYIIFTPLFIIALSFLQRKHLLNEKKYIIASVVLFIVCLSPLLLSGNFKTASARSQQVNLTHDIGILNVVNDKRGSCQIDYSSIICQLFQNKYAAFGTVFLMNYFNHFSPELLIARGTPTQYSVLPERGLLYISEFILLSFGIVFLLRQRSRNASLLIAWFLLSPLADSLTGSGHYSRFLVIVPAIQLVAAFGLYQLVYQYRKKFVIISPLVLLLLCYEIVVFFLTYWSYFPIYYSRYSHYGYKDLMRFIHDREKQYEKIVISNSVNDTKQYVFYLFYTKYDPHLYQSGVSVERVGEQNGWVRIAKVGKIFFLPSIPIPDKDNPEPYVKTIFAGGAKERYPEFTEPLYQVTDFQNRVIFALVDN